MAASQAQPTEVTQPPKAKGYLNEVWTELKKVTWPTHQEARKLTAVVLGLLIIVGVFVGTLDFILSKITRAFNLF